MKKKHQNEVVETKLLVPEQTPTMYADALISQAIEKNLDIDKLEKLIALQRDLKAQYAKEQFDLAMSFFQAKVPVIEKTKDGNRVKETGKAAFKFAPFNEIINKIQPLLAQTGLSYTFDAIKENNRMKVTCVAKHKFGHERPTTVDVPMGTGTPLMSAPQVEMSTMTYAKRYAFCNAFGIVTGDEDIDGQDLDSDEVKKNKGQNPVAPTVSPETRTACAGECGSIIEDSAVVAFSKARYNKPLCRDCQTKQQ